MDAIPLRLEPWILPISAAIDKDISSRNADVPETKNGRPR